MTFDPSTTTVYLMTTTLSDARPRARIRVVTQEWWKDFGFNVTMLGNWNFHVEPRPFRRVIRDYCFNNSPTELFVLVDDDMLPFSQNTVKRGFEMLEKYPEYAILSAMPRPHKIREQGVAGYHVADDVFEATSVGGLRFCRRIEGLQAPKFDGDGYDFQFGEYLRSLGRKVGYARECEAFHLGTNGTTVWKGQ